MSKGERKAELMKDNKLGDGWKKNNFIRNMFGTWWRAFRSSSNFRRTFLLAFYTAMILLRTVLNREIKILFKTVQVVFKKEGSM